MLSWTLVHGQLAGFVSLNLVHVQMVPTFSCILSKGHGFPNPFWIGAMIILDFELKFV